MFAHVADILNSTTIHTTGCQPQFLSVNGKRVEEDVGCRVVDLSFLAYDTRDAGQHGEKVEWKLPLQSHIVKIPSALHFGLDGLMVLLDCR